MECCSSRSLVEIAYANFYVRYRLWLPSIAFSKKICPVREYVTVDQGRQKLNKTCPVPAIPMTSFRPRKPSRFLHIVQPLLTSTYQSLSRRNQPQEAEVQKHQWLPHPSQKQNPRYHCRHIRRKHRIHCRERRDRAEDLVG